MSSTFASLLRNSRLASYDRTISQVYTTPSKHKHIGDWGLKRNLPTVIRTRYATIEALDTAEHQTPWQSGNSKVLFLKRWKENFPESKKPAPRSDSQAFNIAKMSPVDFERFLQRCAKRAPEFQQLVKRKELVPDQLYDYLNISFARSDDLVGPTYSDHASDQPYSVEGRILNAGRHGHAVGVGGVVAHLPKRHSLELRQLGDRRVRTFYVESAYIDDEGKPKVVLTVTPPGTASLPFLLAFDDVVDDKHRTITTAEMFLTRRESIGKVRDNQDQTQANPKHDDLMSRIAGLINN
ncbi:hypothetical protein [Parasitella parasitica]|uniref:Uncharacterized protein n=1 Tax=Parasitella parasitica TaxID=35722 RepID=A0A0B7N8J9_9FUNG|nr:hypothetical protein [Parasitella parasitica]